MYGQTVSLTVAVYLALSYTHKVVYFDTPFYECKGLCCSRNACLSFYVDLSSLDCYLNDPISSTGGEVKRNETNLNSTHMEEHLAIRGSCRDWGEENPDGCIFALNFQVISPPPFLKPNEKQENAMEKETTKIGHLTRATNNAVQSPVVCPSKFVRDAKSGTCWQVVNTNKTRRKAEKYCAEATRGGRLAVLDTSDKYEFVKSILLTSDHFSCIHIGGEKSNTSGYIWLNRVIVGGQGWCPGEPIGSKVLSLWPEMGYCYDDVSADNRCDFVCEDND